MLWVERDFERACKLLFRARQEPFARVHGYTNTTDGSTPLHIIRVQGLTYKEERRLLAFTQEEYANG